MHAPSLRCLTTTLFFLCLLAPMSSSASTRRPLGSLQKDPNQATDAPRPAKPSGQSSYPPPLRPRGSAAGQENARPLGAAQRVGGGLRDGGGNATKVQKLRHDPAAAAAARPPLRRGGRQRRQTAKAKAQDADREAKRVQKAKKAKQAGQKQSAEAARAAFFEANSSATEAEWRRTYFKKYRQRERAGAKAPAPAAVPNALKRLLPAPKTGAPPAAAGAQLPAAAAVELPPQPALRSYELFMVDQQEKVKEAHEALGGTDANLGHLIAAQWYALDEEEQAVWIERSKNDHMRYKAELAEYTSSCGR